jgi:hypothetical protein
MARRDGNGTSQKRLWSFIWKKKKTSFPTLWKKTFIGGGASDTEKPVTAPWTNLQLLVEKNFFLKTTIDVAFAYLWKWWLCAKYSEPTMYRVDRWYIFKPKIPIWVNFGGSWNGICWYILWPFSIFYGRFVYFVTIRYIRWSFGIFFPVLVFCVRNIWQTWLCSRF